MRPVFPDPLLSQLHATGGGLAASGFRVDHRDRTTVNLTKAESQELIGRSIARGEAFTMTGPGGQIVKGLEKPPPDPICRHCSLPYSEHSDSPGRMVPRTECLGMRERFEVTS